MTTIDTLSPCRPPHLRKGSRFARRNPMGAFGIGIIVIFVVIAVLAPCAGPA